MISISLCMIVKNEEKVIERCLRSVKNLVDEIIIVDTGSTDKTKEIVHRYTNNVYDFKWCDDFSKARNFSFSKATKEYILWLDADDVILKQDREMFISLKKTLDKNIDIVMMKYNTVYDKNENPTFSYNRERLVKNNNKYKWVSPVHEVIVPTGNILYSNIAISHKSVKKEYSKRNLNIFKKMINNGIKLDARQQYYYARELYYHGMYEDSIKEYRDFLNMDEAWIENKIDACIEISRCFYNINDYKNQIRFLLKSLEYDAPRANICCEVANYFIQKEKYDIAIYWYNTAINLKQDINSGRFENLECYDYIPYLGLCLCYDKIGNYKKAMKYNELLGKIRPDDEKYLYNKAYFDNLKNSILQS